MDDEKQFFWIGLSLVGGLLLLFLLGVVLGIIIGKANAAIVGCNPADQNPVISAPCITPDQLKKAVAEREAEIERRKQEAIAEHQRQEAAARAAKAAEEARFCLLYTSPSPRD